MKVNFMNCFVQILFWQACIFQSSFHQSTAFLWPWGPSTCTSPPPLSPFCKLSLLLANLPCFPQELTPGYWFPLLLTMLRQRTLGHTCQRHFWGLLECRMATTFALVLETISQPGFYYCFAGPISSPTIDGTRAETHQHSGGASRGSHSSNCIQQPRLGSLCKFPFLY